MRHVVLVVVLIGAAFLGGAFVNGPGLRWVQTQVLGSLGLGDEDETASVDLKAGASGTGPSKAAAGESGRGPLAPVPGLVADGGPAKPGPSAGSPDRGDGLDGKGDPRPTAASPARSRSAIVAPALAAARGFLVAPGRGGASRGRRTAAVARGPGPSRIRRGPARSGCHAGDRRVRAPAFPARRSRTIGTRCAPGADGFAGLPGALTGPGAAGGPEAAHSRAGPAAAGPTRVGVRSRQARRRRLVDAGPQDAIPGRQPVHDRGSARRPRRLLLPHPGGRPPGGYPAIRSRG